MSNETNRQWLFELMGDYDFSIPSGAFDELVAAMGHNDDARLRGEGEVSAPVVPEAVSDVAWHIGKAVEYIEKVYPDAKMLDRGPILRNMRRWHERLLAASPKPTTEARESGND